MSSESRIWEIRPFGSMRGGKELVIGRVPFNPSFPAYSTDASFLNPYYNHANRCFPGKESNSFSPVLP